MDQEQRIRWGLTLAIALAIVGVLVGVRIFGERKAPAPPAPAPVPVAVAPAPPAPQAPAPPPTLRRADLLAAAHRATAAYAAGEPYPAADKTLAGRKFELLLPFNCDPTDAVSPVAPAQPVLDRDKKTLSLTAQPNAWTETPWVQEIVGATEHEAIEGFWIPRPWLLSEGCPAPPAGGEAPRSVPTAQTVGLVQVFTAEETRVGRRGMRPYQVVRRLNDEELAKGVGPLQLVLAGRLSSFAGGDVVRCHGASKHQRPICLINVQLERVAFVDPASDTQLAEWLPPAPGAASTGAP